MTEEAKEEAVLSEEALVSQLGADKVELVDLNPNSEQALQQRILDLLSGKEKSPNEMVTYFLGRLKAAKISWDRLDNEIMQMRSMLKEANQHAIELQGQLKAYTEDIAHWDKPKESD